MCVVTCIFFIYDVEFVPLGLCPTIETLSVVAAAEDDYCEFQMGWKVCTFRVMFDSWLLVENSCDKTIESEMRVV